MIEKQCPQCGNGFKVKPSHFNKRTYCSRQCMSGAYKTRMIGEYNPHYSGASNRVCNHCGKAYNSYVKTRKYCSFACAAKALNNLGKVNANPSAFYKPRVFTKMHYTCPVCGVEVASRRTKCEQCKVYGKRSLRTCAVCGKGFKSTSFKKTCSVECLSKHKSLRQQGELSHLWQGGKTDATRKVRNSATYGNWRTSVFERDDYTCQICNCRGGKLAAHHIKPFSTNKAIALEVWNGITLCWECHRSIKGKEQEHEARFLAYTNGCAYIVRCVEDALEVVGL